ncbi:MAG TPA: HEAT repeat domain-containing protein, partial [Steroidobacteraceae bacterium]|nr:HEAT repeat domain-containing protein [Steroidobacteraceae bacterium]
AGIATASSQTLELQPFDRQPTPVVDPASDDAVLALKRFSLPPGLKASLWAAEPMLANPVAIDFDEKGRLFVSETYRYRTSVLDIRDYMGMLEKDLASRSIEDRSKMIHDVFGEEQAKQFVIESEVVRLVEDSDHDGVADKSTIYADGFNSELDGIASGVLARHGKVWFTNIPSLWLLEGEPGHVKKTELLRGFGVRFNFTGHDFHGLALGHDGKIYFSIGDRGMNVKTSDGRTVAFPDEGAVFRANPDGTELEVVHRGLRNPQELVFDEHGNLFTGDNDSDQGDQERLVYLVEGGDSGWRVGYQHAPLGRGGPWMREGLWKPRFEGRPAYLLPPICNIEDGPSGLTYYPGTGLTPEYAGHFFITHFKGSIARSGIQTYTIKQNGATFTPTSSQQFMGGVLPTDVTFGPDGVLYLADWVDGWPKSNKGRIYGITPLKADPAQAKVSADLAKLLAEGFTRRSNQELVALLAHPDRRARLEAQLELAARGSKSTADFSRVANDKSAAPLARLHAVWGLTQLGRAAARNSKPDRGTLAAVTTLNKLLGDADSEVRAQSAKGLGDIHDAKARPALEKLLTDPEPRVQFFAAQSLGKLGNAASAEPLIALLRANDNKDSYLRFAAANALSRLGADTALAKAATDPSAAVRLGVLLAYRYSYDPAIATLLGDSDAYIVREAAEAINDAPVELALAPLAGKLASAPPGDEALVVRALNANYRLGGAARAKVLAGYALNDEATPEMRAEALKQLGLWGKTPARDRVVGIFRPMDKRSGDDAANALEPRVAKLLGNGIPQSVQLAALDAVAALDLRAAVPTLVALVGNEQADESVRGNALKVLDGFSGDAVLEAVALAEKSRVPALRLAALQILAHRAPDRALPVIKSFAATGSEAEQRAAFEAMGQLQPAQAAPLLISGLDRLAAGKVSPGAQVELLDAVARSEVPAVKARWDRQQAAWAGGKDPLAAYAFALAGGDARRGAREFYDNQILPCARCHKVGGNGGEAGPDLSRIGAQQPPEYLLEAVVKPSAHIAPGFDIVTFTLANGETESGSVVNESPTAIRLKRGDGSQVTLDPKQVKQRVIAPSSMPEIYGQMMSRAQLRDVVAFLKALDGSRAQNANEESFGESNRAMQSVAKEGAAGGHP